MHKWTMDRLELEHTHNREIQAHFAEVKHSTLKDLDPRINPDKPPRNFKAAMAAIDNQAWAAAYNSEYIGFKERGPLTRGTQSGEGRARSENPGYSYQT